MRTGVAAGSDLRGAQPVVAAAYVDWPAILAGVAVAVALGIVFTAFGAALGLTALSAERGEGSITLALVLSAVWMFVSMVAAYAAGGYVAGRMRRRMESIASDEVSVRDGVSGLVVWAVAGIIGAMVMAIGVSGVGSAVGGAVGTVAQAAGSAAGSVVQGATQGAAQALAPGNAAADGPAALLTGTLLRPETVTAGRAQSSDTVADAGMILADVATTGEISDSDRAYLVSLTAARTGLPEAEVEARVQAAITGAQAARDEAARLAAEAEETARQAAETARIMAILTGFLMAAAALVAAVASYAAASVGGQHRDEGRLFRGFDGRRS